MRWMTEVGIAFGQTAHYTPQRTPEGFPDLEGIWQPQQNNAMFSVLAVKAPPFTTNGVSYQWQKNPVQLNGNLYWTNIPGATSSTLSIPNVGTNDESHFVHCPNRTVRRSRMRWRAHQNGR